MLCVFWGRIYTALQSQHAVTAYLKNQQLLNFRIVWQHTLANKTFLINAPPPRQVILSIFLLKLCIASNSDPQQQIFQRSMG